MSEEMSSLGYGDDMPAISGWKWGQSDNPATSQKTTFELCYNWTLAANIHNVQVIRA